MNKLKTYFTNIFKKNVKVVKRSIAGLSAAVVMLTTTGCNDKKDVELKSDNSSSISNSSTIDNELDNIKGFDIENWKSFVNSVSKSFEGTSINIDKESLETALLMINSDYLRLNNLKEPKEILNNYFDNNKGVNVYEDENKLFQLLSKIRNNNLDNDPNTKYYSFTNLYIPELVLYKDFAVVNGIEKEFDNFIQYNEGNKEEISKSTLEGIYDYIRTFTQNEITIESIHYEDLSVGGELFCDNLLEEMSVIGKDVLTKEQIDTINEIKGNSKSLEKIETTWKEFNKSNQNTDNLELCSKLNDMRNSLYTSVNTKTKVTKEQIDALFAIINFDWFMDNEANLAVFNKLYPNFDLNKAYNDAYELVVTINIENSIRIDKEQQIKLSSFIIDDIEDEISLSGIQNAIYGISFGDKDKIKESAEFLFEYSKYSNDTTIDAKNKQTGEVTKLDKNSLSMGATQVVNWLTYNTMIWLDLAINDQTLIENTKALVDGHDELSNIYDELSMMYTGKCSETKVK